MRVGFSPKLRQQILNRDGGRCLVCHSTEDLEIDHCLPVCLGGNNNPLNLRVLCKKCNVKRNSDIKRHRTKRVKEYVMKMELEKNKTLKMKETEIDKLHTTLKLRDGELERERGRNVWAWEQIRWLQDRLSSVYEEGGVIRTLQNTISVLQTGGRL